MADNHKNDSDLFIGEAPRAFIEDAEKNVLCEKKLKQFYIDVKKYFSAVCIYKIKKLPFNEPRLLHAELADVRGQLTAKLSDFLFFPKRCPALLHGVSMDTVTEQFSQYQSMDVSTCVKSRMDETWFAIGNIRDKDGIQPLKDLAAVMLEILTIPHSSSHCERIFSTVRKNRTDQRASPSGGFADFEVTTRPPNRRCTPALSRPACGFERSLLPGK